MRINFCGPAYTTRDTVERCVNLYPIVNTSKKVVALYHTPGLELFINLGAQPCRGQHVVSRDETKLYVVTGDNFYRVLIDGTYVLKGTLLTDQGLVWMADNGTEVMIVDGTYGYIYNTSTEVFTQITDADYPGGVTTTFQDGYFISVDPQTQKARNCTLYDGTNWDALDFASAEGDPDYLVAAISNRRELWLYGVLSTEVWYNSGGTDFPFDRIQGAVIGFGIAAKNSFALCDNSPTFLARTTAPDGQRVIIQVKGYQAQIISTDAINEEIAKMSNVNDAEGFSYMQEGHSFYVITFPIGNKTFVYDAATGLWHERATLDDEGDLNRWRPRTYSFFNNFHMVGDYQNGNIYRLKMDVYTENGAEIKRLRVAPEVIEKEDRQPFYIDRLQVPMKTGVGTVTGQGSDPKCMLRYSVDYGRTWSNERFASLGKIGETKTRVRFNRLGRARRRYFELSGTDPVEWVLEGSAIINGD